ncbi:MAG: 5'/3'-nucleotidase SurE [Chloroflexi bacterium]|nr:5'/3'-nucleotidase SurE [Chloroflexota bacterium]
MGDRPLILITNDDGIESPGLRAAVEAVYDLGDVLVVAPRDQQSGSSRSFPPGPVETTRHNMSIRGKRVETFALTSSPATAVRHGLLRFAPRLPDLVISGINYGENVGSGITISGTVGAVLESASFGIPGLAVSLETEESLHLTHSEEVDFSVAAVFTRHFAERVLAHGLPTGVDVLKVDIPCDATPATPWRLTRVSRLRYFQSVVTEDENGNKQMNGYRRVFSPEAAEPDSDIYALMVERVVSVAPITIDLSAHTDWNALQALLE